MKLEFKNSELIPLVNFLQSIKLKGANSRHRSKLVKVANEALSEFQESQNDLLEEHAKKDDGGNFVTTDKGGIQLKKDHVIEYKKEYDKLKDEVVVLEAGAYVNNFKELPAILLAYDEELEGIHAEIYDRLLDEFEKEENAHG